MLGHLIKYIMRLQLKLLKKNTDHQENLINRVQKQITCRTINYGNINKTYSSTTNGQGHTF